MAMFHPQHPDGDYEIAFWIDSNGDGAYQPPSMSGTNRDVTWRTESNTDVGGLLRALGAQGVSVRERSVVILGAGGLLGAAPRTARRARRDRPSTPRR